MTIRNNPFILILFFVFPFINRIFIGFDIFCVFFFEFFFTVLIIIDQLFILNERISCKISEFRFFDRKFWFNIVLLNFEMNELCMLMIFLLLLNLLHLFCSLISLRYSFKTVIYFFVFTLSFPKLSLNGIVLVALTLFELVLKSHIDFSFLWLILLTTLLDSLDLLLKNASIFTLLAYR